MTFIGKYKTKIKFGNNFQFQMPNGDLWVGRGLHCIQPQNIPLLASTSF